MRLAHRQNTFMFTSPHLVCVRERLRFNSRPISEVDFARAYWDVYDKLKRWDCSSSSSSDASSSDATNSDATNSDATNSNATNSTDEHPNPRDLPVFPPYFRFLTLLGLYAASQHRFPPSSCRSGSGQVDVLLLEVGLGGRFDATNVFTSALGTCVTTLDLDHVRVLGGTLPSIAREKGGIYRATCLAFASPQEDGGAIATLSTCAREAGTRLYVVGGGGDPTRPCRGKDGRELELGLAGDFQRGNARLAVAMCRNIFYGDGGEMKVLGGGSADDEWDTLEDILFDEAEAEALTSTRWPGRCQTLEFKEHGKYGNCSFFLDGAHTDKSMAACLSCFQSTFPSGNASAAAAAADPAKEKYVLLFNTSHERDPYALLSIVHRACTTAPSCRPFDAAIFSCSKAERASLVPKGRCRDFIAKHEGTAKAGEEVAGGDESWQHTVASIWKHLSHNGVNNGGGGGGGGGVGEGRKTTTNTIVVEDVRDALDVIGEMAKAEGVRVTVLCTGSLYLVGALLEELEWTEESAETSL